MTEWFSNLELFSKIYWVIALVASFIFVIILVATFMGGNADEAGDIETEIDGNTSAGFQFFTFKNLIAFFTILGWSGIACLDEDYSKPVTVIVSLVCGLLMMLLMAVLLYYKDKFDDRGTHILKNATNVIGEVYLPIGARRSKIGKVHVRYKGALRVADALTDSETDLKSGSPIKVKEVTADGTLIVESLK